MYAVDKFFETKTRTELFVLFQRSKRKRKLQTKLLEIKYFEKEERSVIHLHRNCF